MSRNPPWSTDELVLTLALYFQHGWLDETDPRVVELSVVLNALPHATGVDSTFRNPNGVTMKLANFLALDPGYSGVGLTRGSKRDAEMWEAWADRRDECRTLAGSIRAAISSGTVPEILDDDEGRPEGGIALTEHHLRERDGTLPKRRKALMREAEGRLRCEACDLTEDLARQRFGQDLGDIFECHHREPLEAVLMARSTGLCGLAVLCPTCHRALHRLNPMPSVEQLRDTLTDCV